MILESILVGCASQKSSHRFKQQCHQHNRAEVCARSRKVRDHKVCALPRMIILKRQIYEQRHKRSLPCYTYKLDAVDVLLDEDILVHSLRSRVVCIKTLNHQDPMRISRVKPKSISTCHRYTQYQHSSETINRSERVHQGPKISETRTEAMAMTASHKSTMSLATMP